MKQRRVSKSDNDEVTNGHKKSDINNNYAAKTEDGEISVDIDNKLGLFSTVLTGVCLVPYPQGGNHAIGISDEGIKRSRYFMQNGAIKLWYEPVAGERPDYLLDMYNRDIFPPADFEPVKRSAIWEEYERFIKETKPTSAYVLINHIQKSYKEDKETAYYNSETDNNLDSFSTPHARGEQAALLFARWQEIINDKNTSLKINIWNEPQFETTGNWSPEDFARYSIDCIKAIRKKAPEVTTVIPMHMGDNSWNEQLFKLLADSNVTGFEICNHNYGFSWIQVVKSFPEFNTFKARMGDIARCDEKLKTDTELIAKYGKGKWKFSILEWNLHPEGYLGSFRAANDLASVFHQFNFIKSMSDYGIDAATFFQMQAMTHFSLAIDENLRLQNPPFRLFDWLGRYACGMQRVAAEAKSAYFKFPRKSFRDEPVPLNSFNGEYTVQYLSVMAFLDKENLNIFIVNTHPENTINTNINIANANMPEQECKMWTLTAELAEPMPEAVKAHVDVSTIKIGNNNFNINIGRHSLNVLQLKIRQNNL